MSDYVMNRGNEFSHERKDCIVVALAQACEMSYPDAHTICKKRGRIDKQGFRLPAIFHFKNTKLRNSMTRTLASRRYEITKMHNPHMTIKSFLKIYDEGTFICTIRGHAFCIKNGEVINQHNYNQRILSSYKITALPINFTVLSSNEILPI